MILSIFTLTKMSLKNQYLIFSKYDSSRCLRSSYILQYLFKPRTLGIQIQGGLNKREGVVQIPKNQ